MSEHWNEEAVARYADGEDRDARHLLECPQCANEVIAAMQLKRAVREAVPRYELPASLRARVMERRERPSRKGWMAVAAAALLMVLAGDVLVLASRRAAATRELVDLHTTIVGSANPIDVVSTDKHTVKPWFEGKVPFAVNVPQLEGTPFHLAGGRVVYWRGRPGAYMLITKGAHRISLFAFPTDAVPHLGDDEAMTIVTWRSGGLTYVAIGDLPRAEMETLTKV